MSQYSNTENFCFGVTCAPRASKKNTAVEEKILSRAGKLIVSCKFLSSSLKDTTPVCNSQAVCVDSHNFGVRLLWARGRNSSLVAERVGTTKHPVAVKLFQAAAAPAPAPGSSVRPILIFLPSPPAPNQSLDPLTSSPRSSGNAQARGEIVIILTRGSLCSPRANHP